jgi:hypothetical protein
MNIVRNACAHTIDGDSMMLAYENLNDADVKAFDSLWEGCYGLDEC